MENYNPKLYNNYGNVHNAKLFAPFNGMFIQKRHHLKKGENRNGYRYGFNGKEQDPEWNGGGNMYDYGFRIYDPRIAKFLSVDPLAPEYPWFSPYHFAGCSPIAHIDLDGLEPVAPDGPEMTAAINLVTKFETNDKTKQYFTCVEKTEFVERLKNKLNNPNSLDRGGEWLCGVQAVSHILITHDPELYVKMMIDLYEHGKTVVNGKTVSANDYMKQVNPHPQPHSSTTQNKDAMKDDSKFKGNTDMDIVDYILLGSLRNTENSIDYEPGNSNKITTGTNPWEISEFIIDYFGLYVDHSCIYSPEDEDLGKIQKASDAGKHQIVLVDHSVYSDVRDDWFDQNFGIHYLVIKDVCIDKTGGTVTFKYWNDGMDWKDGDLTIEEFEKGVKANWVISTPTKD
ncbi:MAG: RHS repeat domain-containing protein [Bacteroidia bacterium]